MDNDIKDEISKLVDKLSVDFKSKLLKSVERWEKKMAKKPVVDKKTEKKVEKTEKKTDKSEKKTNRRRDDTDDSSESD